MEAEIAGIGRTELDSLIAFVSRFGVRVVEDWNEPEGARFIGTIGGRTITLFPKYDSNFALFFTVAHLYGHLVQLCRPGADDGLAVNLLYRQRQPFSASEVQRIYDYEREAAEIGRRLLAEWAPITSEIDRQYSRMFAADFHYLIDALERGSGGVALFEDYLRREPVPHALLAPDPRALLDVARLEVSPDLEVIVV